MVLLLLGIVRDDLSSDWRRTLPADIPNYFFINIPPDARDERESVFSRACTPAATVRPVPRCWPPRSAARQQTCCWALVMTT